MESAKWEMPGVARTFCVFHFPFFIFHPLGRREDMTGSLAAAL
jgi:hypothetical protein